MTQRLVSLMSPDARNRRDVTPPLQVCRSRVLRSRGSRQFGSSAETPNQFMLPHPTVTTSAPPAARAASKGRAAVGRLMRSLAFAVGDVAAVLAATLIATNIWAVGVRGQPLSLYTQLWPFAVVVPAVFLFLGLYPGAGLGPVETLHRLTLGTCGAFTLLGVATFLFKVGPIYSRATFLIAWVVSLVLVPLLRGLTSAVTRNALWNESAVLIGSGPLADEAQRALMSSRFLGYLPTQRLDDVPSPRQAEELARQGFTTAILASGDAATLERSFRVLEGRFSRIVTIRGGQGLPVDGIRALNLGGVLGTEFRDDLLIRRNQVMKRAVDLVAGSILLLVSAPIVALAALAVKLRDRGPAFYSQEREGVGGKTFKVRKIRTMCVDAEERLEQEFRRNPGLREEWGRNFKLTKDPRVIPIVGRFLRRWSLDELPQFWSVVKGDMSLVGPRPFPEYHLRGFSPEFRKLRLRVRPGLTGLWQVMVRSEGDLGVQESFDTYYIRNWSMWLDIYIASRTILAVVKGRGAT